MHPAKGLKAWEAASDLADQIRAAAQAFPTRRKYRLPDQLCSAADSIGANLAEGTAKESSKEKARSFQIALGSARETIHFLQRAKHSNLLDPHVYFPLLNRAKVTQSMIESLLRSLH